MDIGNFVDRRLHGVRIAINLLTQALAQQPGQPTVSVDRQLLRSSIETLAMFVEDFEASHRVLKEQTGQKKFVPPSGAKAS